MNKLILKVGLGVFAAGTLAGTGVLLVGSNGHAPNAAVSAQRPATGANAAFNGSNPVIGRFATQSDCESFIKLKLQRADAVCKVTDKNSATPFSVVLTGTATGTAAPSTGGDVFLGRFKSDADCETFIKQRASENGTVCKETDKDPQNPFEAIVPGTGTGTSTPSTGSDVFLGDFPTQDACQNFVDNLTSQNGAVCKETDQNPQNPFSAFIPGTSNNSPGN